MLPDMFNLFTLISAIKPEKHMDTPRVPKNEALSKVISAIYSHEQFDIDQEVKLSGWSNLHKATIDGDLMLVRRLIRAGADVNERDSMGRTALHYAASDGNLEIMRFMIRAGVDESIRGQAGRTARDRAKSAGHEAIYNAAVYQAQKMQEGDGYFGWLAEQIPLKEVSENSEHVMYEDGDMENTPDVEWE
jgi:ankyrin repeat protein